MDNLDRKLEQICSANIELPEWYKHTIRNTLKEKQKKIYYKNKMIKPLIAVCSCLLFVTSIVLATNNSVSDNIKNFFKFNDGMDVAINNGYIAEADMEYINSNNTEVKISKFLMDDFNLNFILDIKFDENIKVSDIDRINFPDFLITDENKRIIYCDNKEIFDEYIAKENLEYEYGKYNENYINNGVNIYIKENDKEQNSVKVIFNLYSTNYPKSQKLYFNFETIQLINEKITSIKGEWNIDIDIPEKFYNREGIVYRVKGCSDDRIVIEEAVLYDTCMKLRFSMKLYNDSISREAVIERINQQNKQLEEKLKLATEDGVITAEERDDMKEAWDVFNVFSNDDYVETENGKVYYPSKSSTEDHGYSSGVDTGIVEFYQTYSLTKNDDAINNLKIYLKYYDNGVWENITIELEK